MNLIFGSTGLGIADYTIPKYFMNCNGTANNF